MKLVNHTSGLVIEIASLFLFVGAARADCQRPFTPVYLQNETAITVETITNGNNCEHIFQSGGGRRQFVATYDSGSIELKPMHGILLQQSKLVFKYSPAKNFKGSDRYSIKVCGSDGRSTGCTTIEYDVTVN